MHFKRRRDQAVLWLPAIFPLGAICIVNMCTCIALSLAYNIHLGWKWHSRSSACRMIWVLAEQRVKSRMARPAVTSGLFSLAGTCLPDAFCQYSSSPPHLNFFDTSHTSPRFTDSSQTFLIQVGLTCAVYGLYKTQCSSDMADCCRLACKIFQHLVSRSSFNPNQAQEKCFRSWWSARCVPMASSNVLISTVHSLRASVLKKNSTVMIQATSSTHPFSTFKDLSLL